MPQNYPTQRMGIQVPWVIDGKLLLGGVSFLEYLACCKSGQSGLLHLEKALKQRHADAGL